MIIEVKTESGSTYRLDTIKQTWERVVESPTPIRGNSGLLIGHSEIVIGEYLWISTDYTGIERTEENKFCVRMIKTSPVTSFEIIEK